MNIEMRYLPPDVQAERLRKLKSYYRAVFDTKSKPSMAVLQDLAFFCFANRSTIVMPNAVVDVNASIAAAGMRDVWTHIRNMIDLEDQQQSKLAPEQEDYLS